MNLAADDLTVGLVTAPAYFSQGGVWVTLAALGLYLCLNAYTLMLTHRIVARQGYHTFPEMCMATLGKPGFFAACAAIFLLNWGAQVGALQILGRNAPPMLQEWIADSAYFGRAWVIPAVVLLAFPITLFKSVARLGIPALFNQIFLAGALGIVFFKTAESSTGSVVNHGPLTNSSLLGALTAVGGLSYFYVCHDMAVQVMHSLHNCTARRWALVSWMVPLLLLLACVALGLLGSLFVAETDDLLSSLPTEPVVTVARYLITLAIFCGVPYNTWMPRIVLLSILKGLAPAWTIKDPTIPGNRFRRNVVHVGLTVLLLVSAVVLAEFVSDTGLLFAVVGAISGVSIGLVLPPLCYLQLSPHAWHHRDNWGVVAVLVIGVCSMVGCLFSVIYNES